jgi:hypothetical protein
VRERLLRHGAREPLADLGDARRATRVGRERGVGAEVGRLERVAGRRPVLVRREHAQLEDPAVRGWIGADERHARTRRARARAAQLGRVTA